MESQRLWILEVHSLYSKDSIVDSLVPAVASVSHPQRVIEITVGAWQAEAMASQVLSKGAAYHNLRYLSIVGRSHHRLPANDFKRPNERSCEVEYVRPNAMTNRKNHLVTYQTIHRCCEVEQILAIKAYCTGHLQQQKRLLILTSNKDCVKEMAQLCGGLGPNVFTFHKDTRNVHPKMMAWRTFTGPGRPLMVTSTDMAGMGFLCEGSLGGATDLIVFNFPGTFKDYQTFISTRLERLGYPRRVLAFFDINKSMEGCPNGSVQSSDSLLTKI
ncbi:hypothetical protein MMC28_005670 [Mycoblastus sanguinarius]|nr:hypothetical protein [Mycoblastus sanguinarius]